VLSRRPRRGIESHTAGFQLAGAARLCLDRRIALVDQPELDDLGPPDPSFDPVAALP